jgi:hypothetical protein
MRVFRAFRLAIALSCAFAGAAHAGALDNIYDEQELADLQPRYERGWRDNYDNVFKPAFTAEERARFANVKFRFERRVPDREPFGFYSVGDQVVGSTASLKFLFEIALAETWLDMSGFTNSSVGDYLTMLRYWDASRGRPPKPLAALCIPPESSMDSKIVERAERMFNDASVFVLLHEYGHAFYRHPGNLMVPPAESRANEQAADLFALNMFSRLGDVPVGTVLFFYVSTHVLELSTNAGSASQQASLGARTHPVSPERLQAIARHITAQADVLAKAFKVGAQSSALALALQIAQFGYLLGDPTVQRFAARIGLTVGPMDLAPRPKGHHLSAPCNGRAASGLAYDGTLRGKFVGGRTEFNVDMVLAQDGEAVSGSFSYGNGVGRVNGIVKDGMLIYRWTLGSESGAGVIAAQNGSYRGTWGYGTAAAGGGTLDLKKEP